MSTLCCFGIDGTLADSDVFSGRTAEQLLELPAYANVVRLTTEAIERDDTDVMFCTARPKAQYGVTWRWLNRELNLSGSGRRVALVCRPDETTPDDIPQYKLLELVQAVRRHRPEELRCYDRSVRNLRLFQTLGQMVTRLRLYRCDVGVTSLWKMGS